MRGTMFIINLGKLQGKQLLNQTIQQLTNFPMVKQSIYLFRLLQPAT